jgi:hypothetical protein
MFTMKSMKFMKGGVSSEVAENADRDPEANFQDLSDLCGEHAPDCGGCKQIDTGSD